MSTKNHPGDHDCYANALPDEPMFILLARDDRAPALVDAWADASEGRDTNPAKVAEARQVARNMRAWREARVRARYAGRYVGRAGEAFVFTAGPAGTVMHERHQDGSIELTSTDEIEAAICVGALRRDMSDQTPPDAAPTDGGDR